MADEAAHLDQLVADSVRVLDSAAPWLITVLVPASLPAATPIDLEVVKRYTDWLWARGGDVIEISRLADTNKVSPARDG